YISRARIERYEALEPGEKKEFYPLSSAQKRLYILQQMEYDSTGYNMPLFTALNQDTDPARTAEIFQQLTLRHESLRTSFQIINREPAQIIHEHVHLEIERYDSDNHNEEHPVTVAKTLQRFVRPFDLEKVPLIRTGILTTGEKKILLVDIHHIISDGISNNILINEFTDLYPGKKLPRPRLQYRDFSQWQNGPGQKEFIRRQKTYWMREFSDEIPTLHLPTDFPGPATRDFAGSSWNFTLGEREYRAL
ncbi:MAG: polyketide synthase, partial [bacterium]|nr:polyketide synthase [bacterium]